MRGSRRKVREDLMGWVQLGAAAAVLLAVQSIAWLLAFIRMWRLADEMSSASTMISALVMELRNRDLDGLPIKNFIDE
jgi:hypothetical protein